MRPRLLRPLLPSTSRYAASQRRLRGAETQTSQGKARHFRSMCWLHLHPHVPDDYWVNVSLPVRPSHFSFESATFRCLVCSFCSSSQSFAYSFFPTPPHDGSSCCSARVPRHQGPRGLSPPSDFPSSFRASVTVTKRPASRSKGRRAMPGTQIKKAAQLAASLS